jgi:hypothetical protein
MLRRIVGLTLALLLAVGCGKKATTEQQAAAAKSAEAEEIDKRARVVALELIQQAADDARKQREAEKQQRAAALQQLRQTALDHPGRFLEASDLQVVNDGKRRLTSVSLTNTSRFAMSDIRGTVDFHGGPDFHGDNGDVLAQVPVQLTGAIARGGSMIFSEQQHTLSGASIQLPKNPSVVTFTVTSVKLGPDDDLDPPLASPATDGGIASASTR